MKNSNTNNGIVKTFNENDFINEFKAYDRMDNFSIKGLRVLFNALEEMSIDCQMNIEMDVIALCCEYHEMSITDIINEYNIDLDDESYDSKEELVNDYLHDNTFVCGSYNIDDELTYLFQAF